MNTSDHTDDGTGVEGNPERTDGGYERADEAAGNSIVRRLRSAGTRSNPTVADQHVPERDADEDVPAIVTWHETLAQGL